MNKNNNCHNNDNSHKYKSNKNSDCRSIRDYKEQLQKNKNNVNNCSDVVFHNTTMPFMTYDGTIGKCDCIKERTLSLSGSYWIEQVNIGNDTIVRWLQFINNPFVIQSEIAFIQKQQK